MIVLSAVESQQMLPYKAIKDECGNFGINRREVRSGHSEAVVRLQGSSASRDSYPGKSVCGLQIKSKVQFRCTTCFCQMLLLF